MVMVSAHNEPEVVLGGWIGDRVRDFEGNARELALTLAACSRWFEWEGRPFGYVRHGDDVFLEAHLLRSDVRSDVTDAEDDDCDCPAVSRGVSQRHDAGGPAAYLGLREERAWLDDKLLN